MASGGACGSRSPSPAQRLPPPFPEPHGADSDAPGEADSDSEGEDIFTGTSKPSAPQRESLLPVSSSSQENGVGAEPDEQDLFADATVELSLDSTQNNQKKELAKASNPTPSLEVAVSSSSSRNPPKSYEELEEEEQEDKFDLTVGVSDPEKVGDGMNAYVAYKVSTQTTMPMFRSKQFSVKRRFSDFLGLYEKLSEKHAQNGFIVPPPPEKSLIGMTKVKVGKEDSSSAEFLEKRRAALERYLRRVVSHPTMLQDPDVREFLEKEELPRAVSTQTLSGAGLLKMFTKATDAVSKMTIKMNESDVWFEEKLQEVECEDQRLRKLHAVVETLVNHRKVPPRVTRKPLSNNDDTLLHRILNLTRRPPQPPRVQSWNYAVKLWQYMVEDTTREKPRNTPKLPKKSRPEDTESPQQRTRVWRPGGSPFRDPHPNKNPKIPPPRGRPPTRPPLPGGPGNRCPRPATPRWPH
ncbi:sorting nexin-1 [Indicator indicator]|uniref:sorting nexin-1 n=1 Tax=Indicator indicator TaxID=1002788 RepID=UPI0023DEA2E6|nr:sorting nexin-1 [Indicator indicator]